jgi:hypothetical protein
MVVLIFMQNKFAIKKTYVGYCLISYCWSNCGVAIVGCYSSYSGAKCAGEMLSDIPQRSNLSYVPGGNDWNYYLGKYKDCKWLIKS